MTYYNTTEATGPELKEYRTKAIRQEDIIRHFFSTREQGYPPHEVHAVMFPRSVPITSVRRAMTNLEAAKFLEKMPDKVEGPYGRPVHLWKRATP